jgi:hypothetical protein
MSGENIFHYAARKGFALIIDKIVTASGLPCSEIQELASTTNVKLKFPEDLAKNALCRDMLVSMRLNGKFVRKAKPKSLRKNSLTINKNH